MFGFLKKDPIKKLEKEYQQKLEEAMHAQRNGDIRSYSLLTKEADTILKFIEKEQSSKELSELRNS